MDKLKSIERLQDSFAKLPGIGNKSAERMAYAVFNMSTEDTNEFIDSIKNLKINLSICPICGMLQENNKCYFCNDSERDQSILMVVSYPKDVFQIEKSNGFKGSYHVLNGEISITRNFDLESLNFSTLFNRIENNPNIKEIIIATNPTIDGETTALYLSKSLSKYGLKITRLAFGLQMGSNIDYTDELTLLKALEGRRQI